MLIHLHELAAMTPKTRAAIQASDAPASALADRFGTCGANDEFLLAATAQNLRKLAKIFPAPQQTQKA